jgi:hypothetical protein
VWEQGGSAMGGRLCLYCVARARGKRRGVWSVSVGMQTVNQPRRTSWLFHSALPSEATHFLFIFIDRKYNLHGLKRKKITHG